MNMNSTFGNIQKDHNKISIEFFKLSKDGFNKKKGWYEENML